MQFEAYCLTARMLTSTERGCLYLEHLVTKCVRAESITVATKRLTKAHTGNLGSNVHGRYPIVCARPACSDAVVIKAAELTNSPVGSERAVTVASLCKR